MTTKPLVNFGLFLAFPIVCFLIKENKELHQTVVTVAPLFRKSLEYTMMYLFAFRGVNLFPGWKSQLKATAKFIIAATCMFIIKDIIALHSMSEVFHYFVGGKVIQVFALSNLLEIAIILAIMKAGYAKLSRLPFFLTAHLWVIYYVNSFIFYSEVIDNYSRFKSGFSIVNEAAVGSMKKFVKMTHEPPMALPLAGLLTFNLEIEHLLVNIFNHLGAIIIGCWAVSNHANPLVKSFTNILSPLVKFSTNELHHDIAYLAICLILSIQVHYWWTLAHKLSYLTGRRTEFEIDPWTVRKVRTWKDTVHDIYDHVKDGILFAYEEVKEGAHHVLETGKDGATHAFQATKEGAKHVVESAAKNAHCTKKK